MSGNAPRIRPAQPADIPALCTLINAAFAIETFLEGTRTDPQRLAAMLATGTILLLEDPEGAPAASIYTELRGQAGYVGMLAVSPARQSGALGRRMIHAAEDHLRRQGCSHIEITVLSLRPELLAPYRRYGFVEVARQPMAPNRTLAIAQDCHEIVLRKPL
jgi:ribosomal protein S18 acetylase RimI-like enzyme